jgi:PAS domain S-box-containing protein
MDLEEQTQNGEDNLDKVNSQEHIEEEVYRQLIEGSTFAIVLINQRGIIQTFNKVAEKLWLYKPSEVVGQNVKMLMPQNHSENHDYYLESYLRTGNSSIMGVGRELEALRKDGKKIPILLTLSEAKKGDEMVFAAFINNITEKKQIEQENKNHLEEIKSSEEELRQNLEELQATQEKQIKISEELRLSQLDYQGQIKAINSTYASIEFTPDGNIITANDILLSVLGYTLEEIAGKHHRIFVDSEYGNSIEYQNFWKDLKNGKTLINNTFKRIGKNGQIVWLDASYSPVFDENNQVVKIIKLAKDVTDFTISLQERSKFLAEIKKGNFDVELNLNNVQIEGDLQQMIQANLGLRDTLKLIINEVNRVVNMAGKEGVLTERLKLENQEGAWNELVRGVTLV